MHAFTPIPAALPMPAFDDARDIARSLEHPEAFRHVFDRHFPVVLRYLAARVGDRAEDLAAATFAAAFAARSRFDLEAGSARPWLFGIATNLLQGERRQAARHLRACARLAGAEPPGGDGTAGGAAARIDARAAAPALAAALSKLSRGDRDVLTLFAVAELTYAEIAAALALPEGTVRSRLNRARRIAAAALEGHAR
jgi:RNA polymerase sigma-70 factor (ECF subfamily)